MALTISAQRKVGPVSQWPNASNTGLAGIGVDPGSLTTASYTTLNTDGQVLQDRYITGTVYVNATNCIIRRCFIDASNDYFGIDPTFSPGLLVEDCTIIGTASTAATVTDGHDGATYRRLNLSGSMDGMKAGIGATIEDCYIHDLSQTEESHNDGIQFETAIDITVSHCAIYSRDTSCILMGGGEERAAAVNCLIENNYFDGGGYQFYGPAGGDNVIGGPSEDVRVIGNVFGPNYTYGHFTAWEYGPGNVWTGNVDHLGNPITA
jgi:hypothetical protein